MVDLMNFARSNLALFLFSLRVASLVSSRTLLIIIVAILPSILHYQLESIHADSSVYYVSSSGDDSHPGTEQKPFQTFTHATSVLEPGDTLIIKDGSYEEQLRITVSGTETDYITVRADNLHGAVLHPFGEEDTSTVYVSGDYIVLDGIEVAGSTNYCIEVDDAAYTTVTSTKVHDCVAHGIYTDGTYTIIDNNDVSLSNLVNEARDNRVQWGSGIKVRIGGDNIVISNNTVYHNYGEGIAVTRGTNTTVVNNTVYDNFSVNIYIDNSNNVLVDKNFVYCTPDSGFERDDQAASAFGMEEEPYRGDWGAQLHHVTFSNNIAIGCHRGIYYWRSDVDDIGLEYVSIIHNTFVNMVRGSVYLEHTSNNEGNVIANNIFHQENGEFGYVEETTGFSIHHNFWSGATPDSYSNLSGKNDVSGDPRFLNPPELTPESFRLDPDSPAANAGADVEVVDDFFGVDRAHPYDLGAHEVSTEN